MLSEYPRNRIVGRDPDGKGKLIGGFRLGYTNGEDEFIAGAFVGGAVDLFKR